MNISGILINWYQQHRRDLPWRNTRDPYRIWLSEVILQQTRVNQGLDYYYRFTERFPDVQSLASASEEEVLKIWQGLGYYSRARNLHQAARTIVEKTDGKFPDTYVGLLKLKGIGEYTAAAISSIAFGETRPVIDGNVARVLSRLFALDEAVDGSAGKKGLLGIATGLIQGTDPAQFNQAIMEFGALQCKPSGPECETCPMQISCLAFSRNKVQNYPLKSLKTRVKEVYYYYLVIRFRVGDADHILLNRRIGKGIWRNLYDFPLVESGVELNFEQVLEQAPFDWLHGEIPFRLKTVSPEYIHLLSHRKLIARFFTIIPENDAKFPQPYLSVPLSGISKYPVPRLIELFLLKENLLDPDPGRSEIPAFP